MDYMRATSQISQTTLRSALGQANLDHLLAHREELNQQIQKIIDESTEPWGIKVGVVEIKDVELPPTMQRAMARQAEAEREKRAKIIAAEGEFQASQQLAAAANVISQQESALQLRYLQTLVEIAVEKNSTIVSRCQSTSSSLSWLAFAATPSPRGATERSASGPRLARACSRSTLRTRKSRTRTTSRSCPPT